MKYWKKLSKETINDRVFNALSNNINFEEENILGLPGSHLDRNVFYADASFLKDAPFLSTLIRNPNHIGCHTLGESETFFKGTHEIERELVKMCANNILDGKSDDFDGYVASGGTEANMQAIWIYRNYFMQEKGADLSEITILCSTDSHYSMSKASNVLNIDIAYVEVGDDNRAISEETVLAAVKDSQNKGKKYFIVVANMMTTMYGSVDKVDAYINVLQSSGVEFKIHVDGAYGGFLYPFTDAEDKLDFSNEYITSVTLDAHKMVQAPYGTGVFLIRNGYINFANTKEAKYVEGEDNTLIGSRSGANAIAIWMILMTYGGYGWEEKITILLKRTSWLTKKLDELNFKYYRNPHSNIITIRAEHLNSEIAAKYGLVPDNHGDPKWYKVVVMDHVSIEKLTPLVEELS
jgi:tyrosine decarboxylase/aspartate 1-decarboxylase